MSDTATIGSTARDFDFLIGTWYDPQPAAARAPGRVERLGGVRGDERRPPAPRRPRQRGRVPHRPRRGLHRDVVPVLRRRLAAVVDLLGRQPPLRRPRPAGLRDVRRRRRGVRGRGHVQRAARSSSGSTGPASPRRRRAGSSRSRPTAAPVGAELGDGVHTGGGRAMSTSTLPGHQPRLSPRDEVDHARGAARDRVATRP